MRRSIAALFFCVTEHLTFGSEEGGMLDSAPNNPNGNQLGKGITAAKIEAAVTSSGYPTARGNGTT
jgi:hypothetical protein